MKKINKIYNIGVIGLGYVGLPLAIRLTKKYKVLGHDIDLSRIKELKNNNDRTLELSSSELKKTNNIYYTNTLKDLSECNIKCSFGLES